MQWCDRAAAKTPTIVFEEEEEGLGEQVNVEPVVLEEVMASAEILNGAKDNPEGRVHQRRPNSKKRLSKLAKLKENIDKNVQRKKQKKD